MPLKINVPYKEKDVAKEKGAFWDVESKTWFVPDHKDINDFMQWIDTTRISVIVKSPVVIALNSRECYRCIKNTAVISLASDNFYCLSDDGDEDDKWFWTDGFSFFSMPIFIEDEFAKIITKLFPNYKIGYSKTVEGSYWANHCEHCGALQGDYHLYSEPGGAFFPLSQEEYGQLTFIPIHTKFDLEMNTDYSWSSNAGEILENAKSITLDEFLAHRK